MTTKNMKEFEPAEKRLFIAAYNPRKLDGIEEVILHAIPDTGAKVVKVISHKFPLGGESLVGILSESHFGCHLTPGETVNSGTTYCSVEISTCGRTNPCGAAELIAAALMAEVLYVSYTASIPVNSEEPRISAKDFPEKAITNLGYKIEKKSESSGIMPHYEWLFTLRSELLGLTTENEGL